MQKQFETKWQFSQMLHPRPASIILQFFMAYFMDKATGTVSLSANQLLQHHFHSTTEWLFWSGTWFIQQYIFATLSDHSIISNLL